MMFDAIVIGSGPAGSSTACKIVEEGWRVALLERDEYPGRSNVCGGGIEGVDAEEIGVPDDLMHKRITRREHYFPWGITIVDSPHITILRRELDCWLAEQAIAAGAELFTGTRARHIVREATGKIAVIAVDRKAQAEVTYYGRLVVFADGPNTLASRFGNLGFVRTPMTAAVGLVYELALPNTTPDHYEVHFGAHISPWGYIWIFPKRDLLNVGITMLPSRGSSRHLEAQLRAFIEGRPDLKGLKVIGRAGAHIPIVPATRIYDDSMLVVGDAAGMVEALTEAGIANAVVGGRIAGQVACEALMVNDLSMAFLSHYQTRWQATSRYRMIRFQSRFTDTLLSLSRCDKNLYAKIMQVLFLGDQLSRWQKLCLLAYPISKSHTTHKV
jgi:digeranylgeranylglycerophospholipid reductase